MRCTGAEVGTLGLRAAVYAVVLLKVLPRPPHFSASPLAHRVADALTLMPTFPCCVYVQVSIHTDDQDASQASICSQKE